MTDGGFCLLVGLRADRSGLEQLVDEAVDQDFVRLGEFGFALVSDGLDRVG